MKLFQFLKDVKNELLKVIWPTRKQAVAMTIAVIVLSVIIASILGAVDYGLTQLLERVILKE